MNGGLKLGGGGGGWHSEEGLGGSGQRRERQGSWRRLTKLAVLSPGLCLQWQLPAELGQAGVKGLAASRGLMLVKKDVVSWLLSRKRVCSRTGVTLKILCCHSVALPVSY